MATPLVIDVGSHSLKAGIAGEALPRLVTRSVVGAAAVGDGLTTPSPAAAAAAVSSAAAAASTSGGSTPGAAAATTTTGEPVLLQQLLNPLEKTDHVEVLPVMIYKATRFDEPGTYLPHPAVISC